MDLKTCIVCSIKKQALIHILILPDRIKGDTDYFENIYKLTREKVKDVRSLCTFSIGF